MEVAHLRRLSTRKTKRNPLTSIITMEEPNYFLLEYIFSAELQTSMYHFEILTILS